MNYSFVRDMNWTLFAIINNVDYCISEEDYCLQWIITYTLIWIFITLYKLHFINSTTTIGVDIKFAYGWVDLETPGGIPIEVIVGATRDPLMLACLRVSNLQESTNFFINQLGMKILPFPLSRPEGSNFEPIQPIGSVFIGYGRNSMGFLLITLPPKSKPPPPPLVIGTLLESFNLVYDSNLNDNELPPLIKSAKEGGASTVYSPDGYPFYLISDKEHEKIATEKITF